MQISPRRLPTIIAALLLTGLVAVGCAGAPATPTAPTAPVDAEDTKNQAETQATPATTAAAAPSSAADVTTSAPAAPTGATAQPAAPSVQQVEGTVWAGTDSDGDYYVYRFNANGLFGYTSPQRSFDGPTNTWSQAADQVTMSTDNGYSTYLGTIEGDTISGTASNRRGQSWTWTATPQQ